MTPTLHWLRNTSLTSWLPQHSHLLSGDDALLISGTEFSLLPAESPVKQPVYARQRQAAELATTVPDYVVLKSDEEWVELVLSFPHQITW